MIDNKLKSANSVTVKSANPSYPITNVYDDILNKLYKTLSKDDQYITIVDGEPVTLDTILIYGHNLTSSATVTLKGSNTLDFDSPDYELSLTVNASICATFNSVSFTGWRIEFDDPTNTESYIEIQEIFIGECTSFPNFSIGFEESRISLSSTATTRGGIKYGNNQGILNSVGLTFTGITLAEKDTLQSLFDSVDITRPFWFVQYENNPTFLFVTLSDIPTMQNDGYTFDFQLQLVEQK